MNNQLTILESAIKLHENKEYKGAYEILSNLYKENPDSPEICYHYGNLLIDINEEDLALEIYLDSINKHPYNYQIWFNLGYIFQKRNDFENAMASYDNVIRINPGISEAYKNMAEICYGIGDTPKVKELYLKALELAPDDYSILCNLGHACIKEENYSEATEYFEKAIEYNPNSADLHYFAANSYEKLKDFTTACEYYLNTLKLNPAYYQAYLNLGYIFYQYYKDYDNAEFHFQKALAYTAENNNVARYKIFNNIANIHYTKRDLAKTLEYYKKAYQEYQDDHILNYNYGKTLVLAGEYEKGFEFYNICMHKYPQLTSRFPEETCKIWRGEELEGKNILVYERAGFGDTFMLSRYLPFIKEKANKVTCLAKKEVFDLIDYNYSDIVEVLRDEDYKDLEPNTDYQIPFMFTPYAFKTTINSIPSTEGYLKANLERVKKFTKYFDTDKLKVGIVWKSKGDIRDIPLKHLKFLEKYEDIQVYSLQKDITSDEDLGSITNLAELFDDFSDTAAALSQLDILISIDTAVANLAGAMGIPTYLLLSYQQDWRWGFNSEISPWFDSVKIILQDSNNDWESAVSKLKDRLKKHR